MRLVRLEAERLRNLKPLDLALGAGLTLIEGSNAQGKTSLLEAVYLLATGRSFRTRRLDDLVSWSGGPAHVAGRVERAPGETRLFVGLDAGVRSLVLDGTPAGDLEAYLGRLDVVDLSSERSRIVHGAPDERRRFLDRGITGLRPGYLRELTTYRRVLNQRNALLRSKRAGGPSELGAWDERLLVAAAPLHAARADYAERLSGELGELGPEVLPRSGPRLALRYLPSPASARSSERFAEEYSGALERGRASDRTFGYTREGPHRDDLAVELDGVDLRRFGSAGQVRAAMIALKLAKLSLLRQGRGEAPLFLMDDFDTDLDEARMSALAGFLIDGKFQAIVATSKGIRGRLDLATAALRMDDGVARVM
jgi:DNA replication and repair protein RecF